MAAVSFKPGDRVKCVKQSTLPEFQLDMNKIHIVDSVGSCGPLFAETGSKQHDATRFKLVQDEAPSKLKSDGGSTSYYQIPAGATELNDLIEHKNMSFAIGNIFKACYRLGEKDGAEEAYDLRKIIYFANRRLKQIEHNGQRTLPL